MLSLRRPKSGGKSREIPQWKLDMEEEERARAKAEILRYRRAKEREEDMRRLLRVLLHWKLARAIRLAASKNSERTRFRIEEYQRKLLLQRQRREEEEAALADKEERLRRSVSSHDRMCSLTVECVLSL